MILQNLRNFTVQIRRYSDRVIVGAGIVVSKDGKILTCRHVAKAAGIVLSDEASEVAFICYPQVNTEQLREVKIASYLQEYDDDVILLQDLTHETPLSASQLPLLGHAKLSDSHKFISYGFRPLQNYQAGYADGIILGSIESPVNQNWATSPIQLESSQINQGMSGAPILDVVLNRVVGLTFATWFPNKSTKDRDTAWGIDLAVFDLLTNHIIA